MPEPVWPLSRQAKVGKATGLRLDGSAPDGFARCAHRNGSARSLVCLPERLETLRSAGSSAPQVKASMIVLTEDVPSVVVPLDGPPTRAVDGGTHAPL